MSVCIKPVSAWLVAGRSQPVFRKPLSSVSADFLSLPCGKCEPCELNRVSSMSARMVHEASLHASSFFLTLTYDEAHLPSDGNLVPQHWTKFIGKLRAATRRRSSDAPKLRFVACGEYGDRLGRPHYHAIVFGLDLTDRRIWSRSKRGDDLFCSDWLSAIWGKGNVIVGEVTSHSCSYVAAYTVKSVGGERVSTYFSNPSGDIVRRVPPFARYSTHPGIGAFWYDEYSSDCFPSDFLVSGGRKSAIPRYYFKRFAAAQPAAAAAVKARRVEAAKADEWNTTAERRRVRYEVSLARRRLAKRSGFVAGH